MAKRLHLPPRHLQLMPLLLLDEKPLMSRIRMVSVHMMVGRACT